jgi:uncharacterized protein (DUF427 family)
MWRAVWNGTVVAESDQTIEVEGNQYFPPDSLQRAYFVESHTHTTCPWKGVASYYTLRDGAKEAVDTAWTYPDPKSAAEQIRGYVAFWRDVRVEKAG